MKRLALYDTVIALSVLLQWVLLVVVEVKVREFWFFRYVFWSTLPLNKIAAANRQYELRRFSN